MTNRTRKVWRFSLVFLALFSGCHGCNASPTLKAMRDKVEGYRGFVHGPSVSLMFSEINDDEFAELMPGLLEMKRIDLELSGTHVTDATIKRLTELKDKIEMLHLCDTKITNEGLKLLSDFPKLWSLDVMRTKTDDDGVFFISQIPNLSMVGLPNTITDKSMQYLEKCKKLTSLDFPKVSEEKLHQESIDKLKKVLPELHIVEVDSDNSSRNR